MVMEEVPVSMTTIVVTMADLKVEDPKNQGMDRAKLVELLTLVNK